MIEYDLLKRSSNAIEGHNEEIFYYIQVFFENPSILFCIIPIVVYFFISIFNKEKLSWFSIGSIVAFLSVFIIYTIAKTKIEWYVFPCFIVIAIYTPQTIINIASRLKIVSIAIVVLIGLSCLLTIRYPFTVKANDKTQNFINSIENVKSVNLYIETDSTKSWSQQNLLCAELALDANCKRGGIEEFEKNLNSYIIISSNKLSDLEIDSYEIVYESNDLLLLKNSP